MKILVLSGNPNSSSFNHSMAVHYAEVARSSGHEVELVHIARLDFDYNLEPSKELEPDLVRQQELISWAEHIVLVSPVWLYNVPANVKAYFDRVLTAGFAYKYPHPWPFMSNFLPQRLLKGRSVRIITTQDSYRFISWPLGNPFLVSIPISIFFYVGIFPIRRTVFTRTRVASPHKRQTWLDKVAKLATKGK